MNIFMGAMRDIVGRHCITPQQATPIAGLALHRTGDTVHPGHLVYNPRILVVLEGSKTVGLGELSFNVGADHFLVVTVDLPVTTQIHAAENGERHMAFTLNLDRALLSEVLQHVAALPVPATPPAGLTRLPMTTSLLEPLQRLLALLDAPAEIDFLSPLILREIYFRLLRGPAREVLSQFALNSSHVTRISRVTGWIKLHYAASVKIEYLADMAGMSVTSFHRHFKEITLLTPLQYRTQIRLQAARRMLVSEGETAGVVGLKVGYESQSQFSRDYKRKFGAAPASDAARLSKADGRHQPHSVRTPPPK